MRALLFGGRVSVTTSAVECKHELNRVKKAVCLIQAQHLCNGIQRTIASVSEVMQLGWKAVQEEVADMEPQTKTNKEKKTDKEKNKD